MMTSATEIMTVTNHNDSHNDYDSDQDNDSDKDNDSSKNNRQTTNNGIQRISYPWLLLEFLPRGLGRFSADRNRKEKISSMPGVFHFKIRGA
jgi:hypothetical protein